MSITAHCLVKNEEVFITYTVTSVIDFVDQIIIFDTGSTDATVTLIKGLVQRYPNKIIFEEKGLSDKTRHTALRQEMLQRTKTDWFMVLDGDEVWAKRTLEEVVDVIKHKPEIECIMAPFYLCVGDVYHQTTKKGAIEMLGRKDFFYPRFMKITKGIHWSGDYNEDTIRTASGEVFFNVTNSHVLQSRYWHMTHLTRSSNDANDYSSGGTRSLKRKLTYFIIGRKINEVLPEVLQGVMPKLSLYQSFINFWKLVYSRL